MLRIFNESGFSLFLIIQYLELVNKFQRTGIKRISKNAQFSGINIYNLQIQLFLDENLIEPLYVKVLQIV